MMMRIRRCFDLFVSGFVSGEEKKEGVQSETVVR